MVFLRKKHKWHKQLKRGAKFRLVIPLKRSKHPPEFTARGVAVGMLLAMTPTVGIQMFMMLGVWLFSTRVLKWDFSLLASVGWTWSTNVFTMIPLYYLFYVTGQLMLGHYDEISGFESFSRLMESVNDPSLSFWEGTRIWMTNLFTGWGVPMFVGCIPWAILSSWLGYVLAYRYVVRYREKRAIRMKEKYDRKMQTQAEAE